MEQADACNGNLDKALKWWMPCRMLCWYRYCCGTCRYTVVLLVEIIDSPLLIRIDNVRNHVYENNGVMQLLCLEWKEVTVWKCQDLCDPWAIQARVKGVPLSFKRSCRTSEFIFHYDCTFFSAPWCSKCLKSKHLYPPKKKHTTKISILPQFKETKIETI